MMELNRFNKKSRADWLTALAAETFDLLIIGGGITGASIFRDAAMRGMRVALVEARDFAAGTSSRSSKLIHGGLRYLKNLGFRMARESCRERNLHVRLNKRLVRPVPFLVPIYKSRGQSKASLRLGMMLYEVLSGFGNHRMHRFLSREETLSLAPGIPTEGLTGGCRYYDAVVSDARWTIETVKDGIRRGGIALNHAPVTQLLKTGERVTGVAIHDAIDGEAHEVRARIVINATGVFADQIRKMDSESAAPLVQLSKGTHLVFAEDDVPLGVTTVFSSPIDGRPLFLVKREGCYLYGTTDDWEDADPAAPAPRARDARYLLDSLRQFMPEAGLTAERVQFAYSGFRPLLASGDANTNPSAASREDLIEVAPSGLVSVVGGKLTTARLMARRVLEKVSAHLRGPRAWTHSRTHLHSIGGTNDDVAEGLSSWVKQCPQMANYFRILFQRYGIDAHDICREALRIQSGRHEDPRAEPIRAEVQYVCRNEMVCTLEDLVDRRAGFLYWNGEKRIERLRHGEEVIREELDMTKEEFERQIGVYTKQFEQIRAVLSMETEG